MVLISTPPSLAVQHLTLFHTIDPLLSDSPFLVFYGPSDLCSSSSSYIQSHIFTPAGFQSYPRVAISPSNSTLYAAVNCLPRDEQGDEICRGLAFSLLKYFTDLSEATKAAWVQKYLTSGQPDSAVKLFSASHAASLASRITKVDNAEEVYREIETAMAAQSVSHLDVDVVLPPNSLKDITAQRDSYGEDITTDEDMRMRYGHYAPLIKLFGEPAFIPTSKVKRARSKATVLSRMGALTRSNKETLRREMCEFVDTEESYVSKLYDLVHSVAADFREKAKKKSATSSSPSEKALIGLFPPSLDQILEVNSGFLEAAQAVLEHTENTAIEDLQSSRAASTNHTNGTTTEPSDPTGAQDFALCILTWFPRFAECYGQYVQAHSDFALHLRTFMQDTSSSFSRRVQETGEQRLMSMLIEPIQRLPRYSLYIDNILKQLPLRHPALKPFLKAKDLIAEICSQDGSASTSIKTIDRLRNIVPTWPSSFQPRCRLVTAIDVLALNPPYNPDQAANPGGAFVMLLLAGYVVLLQRPGTCKMSARGLMAAIENPSSSTSNSVASQSELPGLDLVFSEWTLLKNVDFSELNGNRVLRLAPSHSMSGQSVKVGRNGIMFEKSEIRQFLPGATFEARASRWIKDFVRARVESRFSETERESGRWEARSTSLAEVNLELFSAIFEEGQGSLVDGRGEAASTRIVIDTENGAKYVKAGQDGVQIAASVSVLDNDFFRLEVEAPNERSTRDVVTSSQFLPVLAKRIGNLMQIEHQMRNPTMAIYLLQHNEKILRSLYLSFGRKDHDTLRGRSLRPQSPVKMLAGLFGSPTRENRSPQKTQRPAQRLAQPLLIPPPAQPDFSFPAQDPSKNTVIESKRSSNSLDSIKHLEETLDIFILALHARRGNVVGRVVQSRHGANEADVNAVYNALLERSTDSHETAAQASVDVLFAAFENFLKMAWAETIGPVVSGEELRAMQAEYGDDISPILDELAPQNRRALKGIVGLLSDLLDGASNDGDKGALIAAFAEILVVDSDMAHVQPHDFIPLFDRFVEDYSNVFEAGLHSGKATPTNGSVAARSNKTGSISSKASSISKRFGFGSFKEQNKSELPSRASSILRSWSKSSPTKPALSRSQSTELDQRLTAIRRPGSSDRPTVFGAFDQSRPGTGGSFEPMPTVPATPEALSQKAQPSLKKKRRSSLSDLRGPPSIHNSPILTSPLPMGIALPQTSSMAPSPLKPNGGSAFQAPSIRMASSSRKENVSPSTSTDSHRPRTPRSPSGIPRLAATPPKRAGSMSTSMLTQKGILSERPGSGNTPPPPACPNQGMKTLSPRKLRLQSPQKLRERVQAQHKAIADADASLQAELSKIGEELSSLNIKTPSYTVDISAAPSPVRAEKLSLQNLNTRLKALENKVPHLVSNWAHHNATIERDLSGSLNIAEKKSKALEENLALADAENGAIYEKMNDELSKVFSKCKDGNGVEELKRKLVESQHDAAKWKKESQRLRRENTILKAQLN